MDWSAVVAAGVTGIFGIILMLMQRESLRRMKTNHGKTIGQHTEDAATAAAEAAMRAAQVAADLSLYKVEQAEARVEDKAAIERYVAADAEAHAEMKGGLTSLAAQVQALSTPPPRPNDTDGTSK